jgi:hypothetical protein
MHGVVAAAPANQPAKPIPGKSKWFSAIDQETAWTPPIEMIKHNNGVRRPAVNFRSVAGRRKGSLSFQNEGRVAH